MFGKNSKKEAAPAPAAKPKSKTTVDQYFETAQSWEAERYVEANKSKKLAWRVTWFAMLIALSACLGVAALTPLKTVEPFVVRVDNSTGMVDIVTALTTEKTNYDEAINKYFINKYIVNRESYSPNQDTRNHMYYIVGLMSNDSISSKYAEYYNPRYNEEAPLKVYGETASVEVNIKNISFVAKNLALIRFTKTVRRGTEKIASHWIATMEFTYLSGQMSANDRLINPLGFQCTDYRIDPEIVGGER